MSDNNGKTIKRLRLGNLRSAQNSLARIIRELHEAEKPDIPKLRCEGFLINILINSYIADRKHEIESRIDELEKRLDALNEK